MINLFEFDCYASIFDEFQSKIWSKERKHITWLFKCKTSVPKFQFLFLILCGNKIVFYSQHLELKWGSHSLSIWQINVSFSPEMEIHIVHKYLNTRHKLILRNLYRSGHKKWYLSQFGLWKIAIKRVLLLREFEKISFLWLVWFFNSFDWREFNKRFGKNWGRTNFYLLCISKLQFTSVLGSHVNLNAEPMLSFYYDKAPMLWL